MAYNNTRWETRRDDFLKRVNEICVPKEKEETQSSASEETYMKIFEKVFSYIDISKYQYWTYFWAIDGNSKISGKQIDELNELNDYLHRLNLRSGNILYNSLLKNLHLLVSDYISVCQMHLVKFGNEGFYTIDKFYAPGYHNPNYDDDLNDFYEYCWLICDLTLEMTRLLNYLLEKIRDNHPDFMLEEGIFVIDTIDNVYTEYMPSEKTNAPYPGLQEFLNVRSNRNKCYSTATNLDFVKHIH